MARVLDNLRWEIRFLLLILLVTVTLARLWMVQIQNNTASTKYTPLITMDPARNTTHHHPNTTLPTITMPSNFNCPQQQANYSVSFIPSDQIIQGRGDIYSGMWWMSIDTMLLANYSLVTNLEGITFRSFRIANQVLSTVDWLDMTVEHLSKYVKHFDTWDYSGEGGVGLSIQKRVAEIIEHYIVKAKETCHQADVGSSSATQSAVSSTIAILPLRVSSGEETHETRLIILQIAATIASLWNIGFQRAVIVGVSENERSAVRHINELLKEHLKTRHMELGYVHIAEEELEKNKKGQVNVPRAAMVRFQMAIRQYRRMKEEGNNSYDTLISSWLGADPSRWQHIYFTEPDLLLHIRPEAVPLLSDELKKGNLLTAHRLNPIPHIQQFHDMYKNASSSIAAKMEGQLLPNMANFAAIHQLDEVSGDACCDQGKFYPSNRDDPSELAGRCHTNWVYCGFSKEGDYSDWSSVLEKHKLLVTHPFVSIERGTGLPLVHSGQRVCVPKRGPAASCH